MTTLVVLIAQDLLYVLAAVAALVWLLLDRPGKLRLALEAVLGLAVVGIALWVAAHVHSDPRPFLPRSAGGDGTPSLFFHDNSDGFPSDHSAAAGLLATVVARHRRIVGALVGVGAVLIAWARVAAHVHHLQDVAAGLGVGVLGGLAGIGLTALLLGRLAPRLPAAWVDEPRAAGGRRRR